ncbi:MAG TPA: SAM-dependent methyltransferase [Pseudonocardia sp.]|nr:SAM-dependent methyltransferase [Pseudonocardia sp.]
MTDEDARGTGIDTTVPHSARIWNYWLGGKDNYAVDRAAGDEFVKLMPDILTAARETRAFLARVVRHLAGECGIRQFLDVGTGLPTANNTHEVAQSVAPDANVVYVDNDPLVLAHARALLTSTPQGRTRYLDADMNEPQTVLRGAADVLDLTRPVAVLFFGVLGHVADTAHARNLVRELLAAMPSGSYLALSDGVPTEQATAAHDNYADSGAVPYNLRAPDELRSFFDGLEFVEPGFGPVPEWRPELGAAAEVPVIGGSTTVPDAPWGGVARKP